MKRNVAALGRKGVYMCMCACICVYMYVWVCVGWSGVVCVCVVGGGGINHLPILFETRHTSAKLGKWGNIDNCWTLAS